MNETLLKFSIVEKFLSSLRLFSVAVDEAHHLLLCISGDGWQTGGQQFPVRALQIIINYGKDTYSEVLCLGDFLGRRPRSWGQTPKGRKGKEYAIYILCLLALELYFGLFLTKSFQLSTYRSLLHKS